MKKLFTILILTTLHLIFSCNSIDSSKLSKEGKNETDKTDSTKRESNKDFTIDTKELLKDFNTWYNYTYYNIRLAQDFVGLDADSNSLNKADFLNRLATGNFFPFKIKLRDNLPVYKLFKLNNPDQSIQSTIQQMAATEMAHFKMEGKELPEYDFTDLNGKTYNKTNTKGKIVIVKCWFIGCIACVKEFPELNKLVDEYKDRNDILFISLAMDSKEKLTSFLNKKQFKYAVVPDKEKYMTRQLVINEYPTHLLVDKNGKIVKVTNSIDDMIPFIEKQTGKASL